MAYTSVYNWNGYKANSLHWEFAHDARHIEDPQGKRKRSNENIDKARSAANRVLVNDGQGGFRPATSMDELHEAFHRRLGQRKGVKNRDGEIAQRKIRSDTNVATQFVVHLDPKFTGLASEVLDDPARRAEIERYHQVMIDEVVKRMGYDNVIYIAHHWDEKTPHVHIMCTSMTPDNRVQYRHALGRNGKPERWETFHDEMRQALIDAGFETDFERVSEGRRHLEPQIFKQVMDDVKELAFQEFEESKIEAFIDRQEADKYAQETRDAADLWAREREDAGDQVFAQAVQDGEEYLRSVREEWEDVELPKLRQSYDEKFEECVDARSEQAAVEFDLRIEEGNQIRQQLILDGLRRLEEEEARAIQERKEKLRVIDAVTEEYRNALSKAVMEKHMLNATAQLEHMAMKTRLQVVELLVWRCLCVRP